MAEPDNDPHINDAVEQVGNKRKKKDLTVLERKRVESALVCFLDSSEPNNPKLRRGAAASVVRQSGLSEKHVARIWDRMKASFLDPKKRTFTSTPQKKGRCGRKRVYNHQELPAAMADIPLHRKKSLRKLAGALGMPFGSLGSMLRRARLSNDDDEQFIRPHRSKVKPLLKPEHLIGRLMFSCSKVCLQSGLFYDMNDVVHVDEKWFFITETCLRCWLGLDEEDPHRTTRHKSHILKVMFLAAVARPRFNNTGVCTFDGKIGMWPIVVERVAQRNSVNRARGTIVVQPANVDRNVYRNLLIEKVIPAIKEKWPDRNKNITIQQDGAPSHIKLDDEEFREAWPGHTFTMP